MGSSIFLGFGKNFTQSTAYDVAVCFQETPVESSVKVTERVTNGNKLTVNGTKSSEALHSD